MDTPVYNNITTIKALGATIQNDYQVSTWFSMLLATPGVKNVLTAKDDDTRAGYDRLSGLRRLQTRILILLTGLVLTALLFPYYYAWGGIALPLTGCLLVVHRKKTTAIQKLTLILIPDDFNEQALGSRTLYQITEFYAHKYKIPSLIETINIFSRVSQDTAVAFLVMILLLVPLTLFSLGRVLVMVLAYPLIQHALTAGILRRKCRTAT